MAKSGLDILTDDELREEKAALNFQLSCMEPVTKVLRQEIDKEVTFFRQMAGDDEVTEENAELIEKLTLETVNLKGVNLTHAFQDYNTNLEAIKKTRETLEKINSKLQEKEN